MIVTSEQQLLPLVRQRTSRNQHPLANFGTRLKSPCSTDSRRATLPCVSQHSLICPASIIPLGKSFLLGGGDRKLCNPQVKQTRSRGNIYTLGIFKPSIPGLQEDLAPQPSQRRSASKKTPHPDCRRSSHGSFTSNA